MHLHYDNIMEWTSCRVAILIEIVARDPALDCVILQYVGEPIYLTLSTAGMYAGESLTTMGNFGYQLTCGIFLCRREEVLSAPRVLLVLESVVSRFHLVLCFGVVCCFVFVWVVFAVFCFGRGHPVFCIFTCSPTTRE